ncbi:MAG: UDP-3-O-(3-hydroxymyristoyl)glucosamine N-acyltransferase [Cyanobacteria bacterium LVE1205-1]|jgi:UDP-3-O-[3-hydroxymyristoyl] glucosamine N-acyltransferase
MNLLASQILERFRAQGLIVDHQGFDPLLQRISPIEECQPGDLVFVDHAKYLERVRSQHPSGVVVSEPLGAELLGQPGLAILIAPNVRLAMAILKQAFADRNVRDTEWSPIHPSAIIHDTVTIPVDTIIGPGVVIGRDVKLGERVVVMANVVIEHGASIGSRTVLHPSCVIGYGCQIGADVILKSGCIIGSEGFGFAQDEQRRNYRIPQTGTVIIEDRVIIGANTNIDRATYGCTHIHRGVVIDAMCHLAHNVEVGEDSIICAHTGLSGSTRIGKRVFASGQTGTLDHVHVPDDTFLLHRAGVSSSIKTSGAYAGAPIQPLQQYLKNTAALFKLHEIWTRFKWVEKKLT